MRKTHLINEPRDVHGFSSTDIRRGKPYQDGVIAAHWDGEFMDRVAEEDGYPDLSPPKFHTDASAQYSARPARVVARHLDKTPNVA